MRATVAQVLQVAHGFLLHTHTQHKTSEKLNRKKKWKKTTNETEKELLNQIYGKDVARRNRSTHLILALNFNLNYIRCDRVVSFRLFFLCGHRCSSLFFFFLFSICFNSNETNRNRMHLLSNERFSGA